MNQPDYLHSPEIPTKDFRLPFSVFRDEAYSISKSGEPQLIVFSRRGQVFIKPKGARVRPIDLMQSWQGEGSVLATQFGEWVFSANTGANLPSWDVQKNFGLEQCDLAAADLWLSRKERAPENNEVTAQQLLIGGALVGVILLSGAELLSEARPYFEQWLLELSRQIPYPL